MNTSMNLLKTWIGVGSINIFGKPFSGKDTQAKLLAELFDGVVIGGGDILRSHHDPQAIENTLASGGIIPSDFYLGMILPYFSRAEFRDRPLILSSVGRSHGEEATIIDATNSSKHPMKAVISLTITDADVWKRFEVSQSEHDRGDRTDDRQSVLETRLQEYEAKTMPVLEYYREAGLLIEVDGTLSREAVTNEILEELVAKASA